MCASEEKEIATMFYKPSDTVSGPSGPSSDTMDLHSTEDRQDSGLELTDFPSQSSLDSTQSASLTLGSISEEGERMETDGVDSINGNLSKLSLGEDSTSIAGRYSRQQSKSEVEHDSGLFDSISSNCTSGGDVSVSDVNTETYDVMSSAHWMSVLSHKCFNTTDGQVDMDQVLRMFQGNQDGDNLLNLFIIHNLGEPAMFLIEHAPAPDWLDLHNNLRQTPLHLAVMTRQPHIVKSLIWAGASVTEIDSLGNTALHWACAVGCEDIVRYLLEPERDSSIAGDVFYQHQIAEVPFKVCGLRNCEGYTCLHLAAKGGHLTIVQLLLDHGCDPNVGDGKSGRTVLHHAAQAGHVELTSLLLAERRTQCDIEDYGRHTPHDLARGHNKSSVMRLLISHGAQPTMSWGRSSSDSDSDDDDDFEAGMVIQNGHCSG